MKELIRKLLLTLVIASALVLAIVLVNGSLTVQAENDGEWSKFGAFKFASQRFLAPSETLTYSIYLVNSDTMTATADVVDVVPPELVYVDGSASSGGVFDPATHTLSWFGVEVPPANGVLLNFDVTPALAEITEPKEVINFATVTTADIVVKPQVKIHLVPQPILSDNEKPVVNSVAIDEKDVLGNPEVTLHIDASDNNKVEWMLIHEYTIVSQPPRWRKVGSSGWVAFNPQAPWTLHDNAGVHFIVVWVADQSYNRSDINHRGVDYASLLVDSTEVAPSGKLVPGFVPYMIHYEADLLVDATLETIAGNPDLYAWYPGNFELPDQVGDTMQFTTPTDGAYIFVVMATEPSTFNLTINPAGGPYPKSTARSVSGLPGLVVPDNADALTYEPIFSVTGLNPIAGITEPGLFKVFAPVVRK